jgi:hypothetical protein
MPTPRRGGRDGSLTHPRLFCGIEDESEEEGAIARGGRLERGSLRTEQSVDRLGRQTDFGIHAFGRLGVNQGIEVEEETGFPVGDEVADTFGSETDDRQTGSESLQYDLTLKMN